MIFVALHLLLLTVG